MVGLLREEPKPEPIAAVEPVTTAPPAGIVPAPRKRPEAAVAKPDVNAPFAKVPTAVKAAAAPVPPETPAESKPAIAVEKRAELPSFQQSPRPDLSAQPTFAPAR
jgi:hypothetical protein